jgi:hypothetical protein
MSMQAHPAFGDDAILSGDEPDALAAAWSLDELEQSSDLESLRSAWSRTDEPGAW